MVEEDIGTTTRLSSYSKPKTGHLVKSILAGHRDDAYNKLAFRAECCKRVPGADALHASNMHLEGALAHLKAGNGQTPWAKTAASRVEALCSRWGLQAQDPAVAAGPVLIVRVLDPGGRARRLIIGSEADVAEATEGMIIIHRAPGAAAVG